MALLHVYYGRETASFAEVCVRIVVFYVLCFVRYHALVCRVSCDAKDDQETHRDFLFPALRSD